MAASTGIITVPSEPDVVSRAAASMRRNLGEMIDETLNAIAAGIPEYHVSTDETYRRAMRTGTQKALGHFLDLMEQRPDGDNGWRELYLALGAGEMREGRSLDVLQSAIRIGARVGWRRLLEFAEAESLPVTSIRSLADAIWAHVDALANAATQGYTDARQARPDDLQRPRRRLLNALVSDPQPTSETVSAAAAAAHWPLPERVAVVLLEPLGAGLAAPVLTPDVLVDVTRPDPALIFPDPQRKAQLGLLATRSLTGYRAAVGPAVILARAPDSFRLARQALALTRRGIIPYEGPVWAEDNLSLLMIFQDDALLTELAERRLAPMRKVRVNQQGPLADTLLSWLQNNMNANTVAAALHLHPQTVRRRLRQLEILFADQLHDAGKRFELEAALRAERATRGTQRIPGRAG